MLYSALEDNIVARLQPLADAGFLVAALPQKESLYDQVPVKTSVFVCYKESEFKSTGSTEKGYMGMVSTDAVVQDEIVQFECIILSRKLRDNDSAHALIKAIRDLLIGYRPADCGKIFGVRFNIEERRKDVFFFSMVFATKRRVVEIPDEEILPVVEQILISSTNGDDIIVQTEETSP